MLREKRLVSGDLHVILITLQNHPNKAQRAAEGVAPMALPLEGATRAPKKCFASCSLKTWLF